jgi:uncharacterized protein YbjT (DUF2867 family)
MSKLPYSRVKLAAEELVRMYAVPWSIVRGTGFYWLLERLLAKLVRRPPVLVPGELRMQPVRVRELRRRVRTAPVPGLSETGVRGWEHRRPGPPRDDLGRVVAGIAFAMSTPRRTSAVYADTRRRRAVINQERESRATPRSAL